ncbi:ROK family protein [Rhizobium sp. NFR07]|uniref:ROK family protein n=1 Tax=Rhizobium sp. NFR07 TaxID=1566262 RepID=UPI001AEC9608|nr:ROK family protein [Rhizobium sp. NFR07]
MAELDRFGYVEKIGEIQGAVGRKAAMYRLGENAGHIISVDAGSTHVRLRVSTLDRRLLHHRTYRLSSSQRYLGDEISAAVAEEIQAARDLTEKTWGPLRAIGIALPSRVVNDDGDARMTRQEQIFSHFTPPSEVPVVLENNVNCAAIAEHSHGIAKGRQDFAYVQIGLKIGMGIVLRGQLLQGRNGAAGEISHIAFPFAPNALPSNAAELEYYLGSEALMARVQQSWPANAAAPPQDTTQLLTLAEGGSEAANAAVERHARDIGAVVATCISIVDPGLVVLGGGIGTSPLILSHVRDTANRLSYPTEIKSSTLGAEATVLGIEQLAAEHACNLLIGDSVE